MLPEGLRNWLYSLTINEFGFFSRSFDLIDQFLGLKFMRFDKKTARRFAIMVASVPDEARIVVDRMIPAQEARGRRSKSKSII